MEQPRKLKSGRWQARVTDVLGNRSTLGTYATKKEAQKAMADAIDLAGGGPIAPTITFAAYSKMVMKARSAKLTPESARNMQRFLDHWLMPVFGRMKVTDIRYTVVSAWFHSLPRTVGRRGAYMALSAVLTHAYRDGLIRVKPTVEGASEIVTPESPYFTPDQVWAVLDQVPEPHHLLFCVQFGGSLRLSEVLGLNWDAVDLTTGVVQVRQQFYKGHLVERTKNKKTRAVALDTWALEMLREHRKSHASIGATPVFTGPRGGRLSSTQAYEAWGLARDAAGVEGITTQDMRHTSLTLFREVTGDMVATMERAGHRDFRSAMTYQHVRVEGDDAAVNALSERTRRKTS